MENLLNVHPGLMIWTVVTFLFVVLILWKFVWAPILKGLDQRADKIEGDLQRAENARLEAEKSLSEYKEQLAKARDEANSMIQESRIKAEEVKARIVDAAEKVAEEIKEKAKQDIELSKRKALDEIQHYAADLIVMVSKKVIAGSLKGEDHKSLIDKAIGEYEDSRKSGQSSH